MRSSSPLKRVLEIGIARDRFAMPALEAAAMTVLPATFLRRYESVTAILGGKTSRYVLRGIIRAAFLIELVKTPKIETTKFEVRWTSRFDPRDPRFASYEDCLEILEFAIAELEESLKYEANRGLLHLIRDCKLLAYELPFDYKQNRRDDYIHRSKNMFWIWDELVDKVVKLRAFLLNKNNPYFPFFAAAYEKVKVKTYLTDRVLTGLHKTNRESGGRRTPLPCISRCGETAWRLSTPSSTNSATLKISPLGC